MILTKKTWVIFGTVILLLAGIIIVVFPIKYNIDTTLHGIKWRSGDINYQESVEITIKGTYKKYLFKVDEFYGRIAIEGYDYTYNENAEIFTLKKSKGIISLTYYFSDELGHFKTKRVGAIVFDSMFKKLVICVSKTIEESKSSYHSPNNGTVSTEWGFSEWNPDDGTVISASCATREEALKIAMSLSKQSQWLSHASSLN